MVELVLGSFPAPCLLLLLLVGGWPSRLQIAQSVKRDE